ncbi:MAG: VCBS repeat-containing protein [Lentisphaerae bacterium]|nr:VCBS repeat-containing protein [Lentisphaerota bacterium]
MMQPGKTFGIGRTLSAAAMLAAWLAAPAVRALINPRFTPVQLVKQSSLIVSVDVKQGASKEQYTIAILETLKGKTERKSFQLDLTLARDEANAEHLRALVAAGKPALLFVGEFEGAEGGAAGQSLGLMHVSGRWASCVGREEGVWIFDNVEQQYQAVWAGGTDMLRRAVDYILRDEDPMLPVTDGVSWSPDPVKLATLDGAIRAVRPVDLAGDGKLTLFVARDNGDSLFSCGADREFTDITATRGLQSKSAAFAWGDFAGEGRLDLVSCDGKAVTLHAQQADGKFAARPLDPGAAPADGCLGLTALDAGPKGRSGFLVSGNGWPVLVALDAEGKPAATPLSAAGIDPAKLGKAGPCLAADFDGDSLADVLALREAGSVLFRGTAVGKFGPGSECVVSLGKGLTGACLGDFDGDGRLDVLAFNSEGWSLWENEGDGKFADRTDMAGEFAYVSQRGGADCVVGDMNNDGRQDILVAYSGTSPHLFFNRGFRSFGHAHTTDLAENHLLPDANNAEAGQQSACLADFDGDGAQDMALALNGGEIWVFFRENSDGEARMAVAGLPVSGAFKGPVAVTGWIDKRCLGAWNVLPGVSRGNFGRLDAGPVTLKWRLPGGGEQSREIVLEEGGAAKVEIK